MGNLDKPNDVELKAEKEWDNVLRPKTLNNFIGQQAIKTKLDIAIKAASQRQDPTPHLLLMGPPGLGKTTLANIIGTEANTEVIQTMATSVKTLADIIELVKKVKRQGIIFIDEIHSLDMKIQETLHSAMEDFFVNIKIGDNQLIKINLNPFCLIGATTLPGKISGPFRDRFDLQYTMQFYKTPELCQIIKANLEKLNVDVREESAIENISKRCRGTPRIANRLLRRVRDFAQIRNNNVINNHIVNESMALEGIDEIGLTAIDRKYLEALYEIFHGKPAGIDSICAAIEEDKSTVMNFIEPFLLRKGLILKDKRGRMLSNKSLEVVLEQGDEELPEIINFDEEELPELT